MLYIEVVLKMIHNNIIDEMVLWLCNGPVAADDENDVILQSQNKNRNYKPAKSVSNIKSV